MAFFAAPLVQTIKLSDKIASWFESPTQTQISS